MQIPATTQTCAACSTQLGPMMLSCPGCGRLVHADTLATLAKNAQDAQTAGDIPTALAAWREALDLLPPHSKQFQVISAKITELGRNFPNSASAIKPAKGQTSSGSKIAAGAGAAGLLLWKLKILLLGLGKASTLLTMLLSLGVYWSIWGWKFALGIVLSIYIHEMGHVIALRRYGFKATAPMFIPGFGAVIRLQQHVANPREDAEIGLAGPMYGLGAAIASLVLWVVTKHRIFAVIAGIGAWINLFNLLPVGTLDGGRGFHAMSRTQKFLATAAVLGAWGFSRDGLLILLALVCAGRALGDKSQSDGNWKATFTYILLVLALTALSMAK